MRETKFRNDDFLAKKWTSVPNVSTKYVDPGVDCSQQKEGEPFDRTDPTGAEDADINNIVARFHKTGVMPGVDVPQLFADVSDSPSYQDALQTIVNANNQFMAMDAKTRKRFDNDPAEFLDFVNNPTNAQELVNMGLATLRESTPLPAPPEPKATPPRSSNAKQKPEPAKTEPET